MPGDTNLPPESQWLQAGPPHSAGGLLRLLCVVSNVRNIAFNITVCLHNRTWCQYYHIAWGGRLARKNPHLIILGTVLHLPI